MSLSAMGLKVLSPFSASLAMHDLLRFVCVRIIERLSLLKRIQAGFKLAGELAILLGHFVGRIDLKHRAAKLLHFTDVGRLADGRAVAPNIWVTSAVERLLDVVKKLSLDPGDSSLDGRHDDAHQAKRFVPLPSYRDDIVEGITEAINGKGLGDGGEEKVIGGF